MEPADARCAFHQNQPATFRCGRCGNPACELCRSLSGGGLCAACYRLEQEARKAAPPPAPAPPVPADEFQLLLRDTYALPARLGRELLPLATVLGLAPALRNVLIQAVAGPELEALQKAKPEELIARLSALLEPHLAPMMALNVLDYLLTALVSAVLVVRFTNLLAGERPAAGWALALRRLPRLLLANLLCDLLLALAALAFCLPALPVYALLLPVTPLVVLGGLGPVGALSRATALVRGRLGTVIGLAVMVWGSRLFVSSLAGLVLGPLQFAGPGGAATFAALSALAAALAETLRFAAMAAVYARWRK